MKAFISHSHHDAKFLTPLYQHFAALRRQKLLEFPDGTRAGPGTATLMSSEIANFRILLPNLKIQHEVALHCLETKKELHEEKLTQLQFPSAPSSTS